MSLFVCEECECVENTALSRFWTRRLHEELHDRALCSECDPATNWHGRFPRHRYDPTTDRVQFKDGEWIAATEDDQPTDLKEKP